MKANARKRLAQRIRLLRTNRGWSQEVLAELSGLNRSYIGAVERAEHNIGLDNIERIAAALEINLPELLNGFDFQTQNIAGVGHTSAGHTAPAVVIHRKVFMELLNQCGQHHRHLILVYLERCGATLRD